MTRLLSSTLVLFMPVFLFAQYGDFGVSQQPLDTQPVDSLIDFGEVLDFDHGYHVGDTVYDFTVYDFHGNPLNLYDELAGEKPVIMVSGSVSCLRFRGVFEEEPTQSYYNSQQFIETYKNDFNWIFVYGVEAHPTDGNCPSNCPPTISNDTTVLQHPNYHYRRWAVKTWEDAEDHDFPFTMYCDNPDNAVYNNFFGRPFGIIALNCDGTVAHRGDWFNTFIDNHEGDLLSWAQSYSECSIEWEPEEDEENDDSEEDGNDEGTEDEDDNEEEDEGDDEGTEDDDDNEEEEGDDEGTEDDDDNEEEGEDDTDNDPENPDQYFEDTITEASGDDDTSTGVASFTSEELHVYPNPSSDQLVISWPADAIVAEIRLVSITGKVVHFSAQKRGIQTLDVSAFAPGMYVLTIQSNNSTFSKRVVIRR